MQNAMNKNDLKLLYIIMLEDCHYTFRFCKSRKRCIMEQKQIFAAVARHFGATFQEIGDFLKCTHATVFNLVKRAWGYMDVYPDVKRRYYRIRDEFEYRARIFPLWIND